MKDTLAGKRNEASNYGISGAQLWRPTAEYRPAGAAPSLGHPDGRRLTATKISVRRDLVTKMARPDSAGGRRSVLGGVRCSPRSDRKSIIKTCASSVGRCRPHQVRDRPRGKIEQLDTCTRPRIILDCTVMKSDQLPPEGFASLYRRAFAEYGTRALWNKRLLEAPTPEDALVVARALRIEGDRAARQLAEQIEQACRAAL